jgi:hypothetical protein
MGWVTLFAMDKRFVGKLLAVLGATLVATSISVGALASAAVPQAPKTNPGQGLEISPPLIELTANPGQTVTTQIRVRNVTNGALQVTGEADDFGANSDESGTPQIFINEQGETRYSLKYWISDVPNLLLAPQELKTNMITINVPANAEPGGHYGVVRFTGVPAGIGATSGVSLSASVGALILLTVNGDITHQLNTIQFAAGNATAADSDVKVAGFFEHGPISFLVRLQNNGSVHEAPHGSIVMKNAVFGPSQTLAVNANGGNVLPASIRRFVQTMPNKMLFGFYTAKLSMVYDGNKTLVANTSFWVIPWKLILLVLVGLLVLGYLLKIGIRKYNEHIIAMARRR